MPSPTIKAISNLAILWGATNAASGPNSNTLPSGALIETIEITPKNGDPIEINDGDGFVAVQVFLDDGFDARISCVADSNKGLPKPGDAVVIVAPKLDGNAGTTNYNCTFWSATISRERGRDARVTMRVSRRPNINP